MKFNYFYLIFSNKLNLFLIYMEKKKEKSEKEIRQSREKILFIQKLGDKVLKTKVNLEAILSKSDTLQTGMIGLCTKKRLRHTIEKKLYPEIEAAELEILY